MPSVQLTKHLLRHLDCETTHTVAGTTVREALESLFAVEPKLRGYILDDQSRLRQHVVIYVGENVIRDRNTLSDAVQPADTVHVLQALSGG